MMTKMVDGEVVELTPDEVTARQAEEAAWVPPLPVDQADLDLINKHLRALALCIAQVGGLTPLQMKVMFRQKMGLL